MKFLVNDYALIWNLLFQASFSEGIYKLKQKLWDTYRNEYNETFKDKELIMKDPKNFIPNNDTIYNIILENKNYEKLRKQVDKYRLEVMRLWDKNKKITEELYEKIIRMDIPEYNIFIVNKELNIIDHASKNSIVLGKEIDKKAPLNILLEINMSIIINNIKKYNIEDNKFKKAIIELAVLNEYATSLCGKSCYLSGSPDLIGLKRWLYPYWLMYMGVPKEQFLSYIMRDQIAFEIEKYAYEKELRKMNLEEFIDFCIRNQKYIIREKNIKQNPDT